MHFILSPATCEGTNVGVTILWLLLPTIICIPRLGGVHGNVATVISSLIWQRCSVFLLLLDNTYNGLSELHISLKLCFCSFMMHPCFVVEEEDEENMEKLLQLNNFILMNIRMYPIPFQDYSHHCSISSCCNFVQFYYLHLPLNENCTCSFYCLQLQHLALGKRYCTFNCPSPVGCHLIPSYSCHSKLPFKLTSHWISAASSWYIVKGAAFEPPTRVSTFPSELVACIRLKLI